MGKTDLCGFSIIMGQFGRRYLRRHARHAFSFLFLVFVSSAWAQGPILRGIIIGSDGQALSFSSVNLSTGNKGVISDEGGAFSVPVYRGNTLLEISHVGYKTLNKSLRIENDTLVYFILESAADQLSEIEVTGNRIQQSDQFESSRMSTYVLSGKEISSVPVLGGEADLVKVIQLLPGVSKGVEGSTDLFVRGGAADQNLVLLDGATIYNTGHLFGFLSVFNPDILEGVEYINGAFPAQTGGRLSSILNVQTKSGLSSHTHVEGNIGLLASRLMVRQPLVEKKLDLWVAGRRTYIDQVAKVAGLSLPYYFYDINAKLIYKPTARDLVLISHYSGEDILNYRDAPDRDSTENSFNSSFVIANSTQTLLWERQVSAKLHSTLNLHRTRFNYDIKNTSVDNSLLVNSAIQDFGGKWIVRLDSIKRVSWTGGIEMIHHQLSPSIVDASGFVSEIFESTSTNSQSSLESSAFLQADGTLGKRWMWSAGFRLSSAAVENSFYTNPEPRAALRYQLNETLAVKASYSRMSQYIHRISSSAISFPTDVWYPVTSNIRPQTSDQFTLGMQKKLPGANMFFSIEGYYKSMQDLVGYREGANLFMNADFEDLLIQGKGKSTGLEVLLKKEAGKFTGWISYTLSKSDRQYNDLNGGRWFPARYDRRHNASVVLNYELTKRLSVSAVFDFISGSRFTPVIGQYAIPATTQVGVQLIPIFAPINSVRLADSHRLDLGLKYRSRTGKKLQGEWFIGIYNVYNRATPYGINIQPNADGSYRYEQPGLFGLLPFISYGFKF